MKVNPETGEILDNKEEAQDQAEAGDEAAAIADDEAKTAIALDNLAQSIEAGTVAVLRIAPGKDQTVQKYADEALRIQRYAQALRVDSLPAAQHATQDVIMVKKLIAEVELEQKKWLTPLKEREKAIKAAFALLLDPLAAANHTIRSKLTAFRDAQEAIRKEEERAAELQRQANEAKLKLAEKTGAEVVELQPVAQVTAPQAVKTVRTDLGIATAVTNYKWEWRLEIPWAERMARLPAQYHMPNDSMIGQAVRAMKKNPVTEADFGGTIRIWEEHGERISEKGG